MYGAWYGEALARERQEQLLAEAKEQRLGRVVARPGLRAWAARRLFGLAILLERRETWQAVWERLEAPCPRQSDT